MASAKRPSLLSPIAYLRRGAIAKGVFGGRNGWLAVGAVIWAPRVLKKLFGRTEEVLTTEKLKPGQTVAITAIEPLSRRERRAAKRA